MAKKRAARAAARKVRDKWRTKTWYPIRAPTLFNEAVIAETLADDTEKLKGRVTETTLQDLTGDFSKMHVKVFFRLKGVRGADAVTSFDGHDLTTDYVRRLVRRRQSKIDDVVDVTTSDGFEVRVKPMIVTERRLQTAQEQEVRRLARAEIESVAGEGFAPLVKGMLSGDLGRSISESARKIGPVKRAEIRRSQVVSEPTEPVELPDIFGTGRSEEEEEASEEVELPTEEAPEAATGEEE